MNIGATLLSISTSYCSVETIHMGGTVVSGYIGSDTAKLMAVGQEFDCVIIHTTVPPRRIVLSNVYVGALLRGQGVFGPIISMRLVAHKYENHRVDFRPLHMWIGNA